MKRRQYKIYYRYNDEDKVDVCGTFMSIMCLMTSKLWGKFDVKELERCEFCE